MEFNLSPRQTGSASVNRPAQAGGWNYRPGRHGNYRLAQLDDYARTTTQPLKPRPTLDLPCERPCVRALTCPAHGDFGLWNDPFGLSLGFGGGRPGRLPTLPQTAWFMHASPPNWLSLRDDPERIPANGFFAGTFRSAGIPSFLLAPGLLALPLCAIRPISRFLRRLASRFIHQEGARIDLDVTQWHEYSIQWLQESCCLQRGWADTL